MRTLNYRVELTEETPYVIAGIPAFEEDLMMKLDFGEYPSIQMEVQTYYDKKLSEVFTPMKSLEDSSEAKFSEDLAQNLEDVLSGKSNDWRLIGAGISYNHFELYYANVKDSTISDSVLLSREEMSDVHQVSFRCNTDVVDISFMPVENRVNHICEHNINTAGQRFIKFDSDGKHMSVQEFY